MRALTWAKPDSPRSARRSGDRYELTAVAGAEGMGTVWKARVLDPDKRKTTPVVAIKSVRTRTQTAEEALRRELDLLSALREADFFPELHESIHQGQDLFIVMDWLEGQTLKLGAEG